MNRTRNPGAIAGMVLVAALVMAQIVAGTLSASAAPAKPVPPAPTPVPTPTPTPTPVPTPPTPAPVELATVTVLGIFATSEDAPHIDAGLQPIANELRVLKSNSLRLIQPPVKRTVVVGAATLVSLGSDYAPPYALHVAVDKASAPDASKVTLTWQRAEKTPDGRPLWRVVQKMQISLKKGKYFLSGGWVSQDAQSKDGTVWAAVAVN
jgi:hypothetical protein